MLTSSLAQVILFIPQRLDMANFEEPTVEDAQNLFKAIEEKFPHSTLGIDKWYLVAVSSYEC